MKFESWLIIITRIFSTRQQSQELNKRGFFIYTINDFSFKKFEMCLFHSSVPKRVKYWVVSSIALYNVGYWVVISHNAHIMWYWVVSHNSHIMGNWVVNSHNAHLMWYWVVSSRNAHIMGSAKMATIPRKFQERWRTCL